MKMRGSRQDLIFAVSLSLAVHLAAAGVVISSLAPVPAALLAPIGERAVTVSLVGGIDDIGGQAKQAVRAAKKEPVLPRQETRTGEAAPTVSEEKKIPFTSFASLDVYTNGVSAHPGRNRGSRENDLELAKLEGTSTGAPDGAPGTATAPHLIPAYRQNSPPRYPAAARQRGYEGLVLVSAEIRPDGRVGNLSLKKSSGYPILDDSAMDAVRKWLFRPGQRMGVAISMWVDVPVRFALNE